jgi:cytochrome c biogenesis protein
LNNEITEYPLVNILNNQGKVWLTFSNNKSLTEGIIAIVDNLEGYCSIYDEAGQFLGNVELNETVKFRQPITLLEIISSTGLQIKTDPGIPVIYLGFFLLMLSTLISYITYSQIWIIQKTKTFYRWNQNRAILRLEFF